MDTPISLQDVANIVTLIAPGYFAMQIYEIVNAKRDRDFSRVFVESVIYSLPIVALANIIWEKVLHHKTVASLNTEFAVLLIITAIVSGFVVVFLRNHWPIKKLAQAWGFDSPSEDFIKAQLLRINVRDPELSGITVKLKNGTTFAGTVDRLSRYSYDGPNYFCFANIAWYDEQTGTWQDQGGNLLINRDEVEYIETRKLRD